MDEFGRLSSVIPSGQDERPVTLTGVGALCLSLT